VDRNFATKQVMSPPFVISDDNDDDSNSKNWAISEQEDVNEDHFCLMTMHPPVPSGSLSDHVGNDSPTGMLIMNAGQDVNDDFSMDFPDSLPTEVVSALRRSGQKKNTKKHMMLVGSGILLPLIAIIIMSVYFAWDRHDLQQQHEALKAQVEVLMDEVAKAKQIGEEVATVKKNEGKKIVLADNCWFKLYFESGNLASRLFEHASKLIAFDNNKANELSYFGICSTEGQSDP